MVEVWAAGLVIFRRMSGIEYLLLQASYENHHWTPPKGHAEEGETPIETALRETKEEAGIDKCELKIYDSFKKSMFYKAHEKNKEVTYWLAEAKNPDLKVTLSDEHQKYIWAPLKEAQDLAVFTEMKDLLHECEQFLLKE